MKKRNQQTESRLLLEADEPVELPPAEIEEGAVVLQFEQFRTFIPELLAELRAGTVAEPVPVMMDGSTFVVHGETRSFWVKLWHASPQRTRIDRAQVISCLPSTRGVQLIVDDPEGADDEDEFEDDDELTDGDEFADEDDLAADAGAPDARADAPDEHGEAPAEESRRES